MKLDKGKAIIIGMIIVLVVFVFVILSSLFSSSPGLTPGGIDARDKSIGRACYILKNNNSCDISKWNEITVRHQDSRDSRLRDYSLKELCELVGFISEQDCSQHCGC